jgi:bacteriocin-like protein
MLNQYLEQWPVELNCLEQNQSDRSTTKLTKQTSSDKAHELSDNQLQSVVGGLQERKSIRVIGFEN